MYCLYFSVLFGTLSHSEEFLHLIFIISATTIPIFSFFFADFFFGFFLVFYTLTIVSFYSLFGYKNVKNTAKILKNTMMIAATHYIHFIVLSVFLSSLMCFQIYFVLNFMQNAKFFSRILLFFYFSWLFMVEIYFNDVFISNIISVYFYNDGLKSVKFALSSLQKAILSIGTICFGALVVHILLLFVLCFILELMKMQRKRIPSCCL